MEEVLANIITSSSKLNFDLPINKCRDISCRDEKLPTLIIGYDLAKKYINGFNILKKFYPDQNLYWTFKRTERGVDYENDLKENIEALNIFKTCIPLTYSTASLLTLSSALLYCSINLISPYISLVKIADKIVKITVAIPK